MKYVYGLNKSGISIVNYFYRTSIPFIAWDDDQEKRKDISKIYQRIVFSHPSNLNFSKLQEAYITPGIDLNNKNLSILKKNNVNMYRDLEIYTKYLEA